MNQSPSRYVTLQDGLRLVREQALVIIIVAIVCAAAAVTIASLLPTKYAAQTQVRVQDTSQALGLVGTAVSPAQTPAELAAQGASTLVTPALLESVKTTLRLRESATQLQGWVSAQPDSTSNLVQVNATAPSAKLASDLANAVARAAAARQAQQARAAYAAAVRRLRARYRASNPKSDPASRAIFDERLSTLEALASVASPLQVVSLASPPRSAASPKPVQDGVIGFVLGVLLGLLIAVLRSALDRRLHAAHEIQSETGLPLLGHVRATALGYAGDVPRDDKHLAPRDVESFRMLRTNTEFLSSNGAGRVTTFAVTSALPEEGKSTTAAALAFAYAATGRRTLLAECDLRLPCLGERLGLPAHAGLISYLAGNATFDEIVFVARASVSQDAAVLPDAVYNTTGAQERSLQVGIENGLPDAFGGYPDVVLAGGRASHPVELLGSARLAEFLSEAKSRYEIVILDTPPVLSVADTLEILPRVEGVILCVRARQTTRDQVGACRDALHRLPAKPAGLVVTGLSDRDEAHYGYYGY